MIRAVARRGDCQRDGKIEHDGYGRELKMIENGGKSWGRQLCPPAEVGQFVQQTRARVDGASKRQDRGIEHVGHGDEGGLVSNRVKKRMRRFVDDSRIRTIDPKLVGPCVQLFW